MSYYRNNNSIKFGAIAVCFVLIGIILCGMMTSWFTDWNPYCWFGHNYNDEGICERCGYVKPAEEQPYEDKQQSNEGGMTEVEANSEGIAIRSRKILRSAYADEGISTLAESAQQLTATVKPADAINKEVDWSVAWKNASSEWANGKNVTDYVTIEPTADGVLTVNISCLQAFGEQVIVTVAVRDTPFISAECTVDYEKRLLGLDLRLQTTFSSNDVKSLDWNLSMDNTSVTVDFPYVSTAVSSVNVGQSWVGYYGTISASNKGGNTKITVEPTYSIFTKDKNFQGCSVSVMPTAEYLQALTEANLSPTATSTDYVLIGSDAGTPVFTFNDLLIKKLCSSQYVNTFEQQALLRQSLKNNINSTMLKIKVELIGADERDSATIYNIKFTESSLESIVESITVSPDTITF